MGKLNRAIIRKMILQEAVILKRERMLAEQNVRIARFCAQKERKMLSEGYSRIKVNESILDSILGLAKDSVLGAPGGFLDVIEQMVIEKVIEKLFGNFDPNSFLGSVVTNVIENIDIIQIGKYFSTGACEPIVEMLHKGISEAIIQQGLSKLFGARSDVPGQKGAGMITSTMRESLTNAINSSEFQESMKNGLRSVICNFDFAGIYKIVTDGLGNIGGMANNAVSKATAE